MVKQFLITRPTHDKETAYLYSFSKASVQIAKADKNLHVDELSGKKANRKNVESSLSTKGDMLAFFNGHGDDETVFGHEDRPILDKDNIILTNKKIVYALACNSLVKLGPLAIKNGAKAYVGYTDEFMWVGDPSRSAVPDKDKNSAPFRKICHLLIKNLLEGVSVNGAIKKTKEECKKLIKRYGTSEDNFGDSPSIGLALAWDLFSLDMVGDPNAAF